MTNDNKQTRKIKEVFVGSTGVTATTKNGSNPTVNLPNELQDNDFDIGSHSLDSSIDKLGILLNYKMPTGSMDPLDYPPYDVILTEEEDIESDDELTDVELASQWTNEVYNRQPVTAARKQKMDSFCRQCGSKFGLNDSFCGSCGNQRA